MPLFENGDVTLHYEEAGDGFPLLVLPGGGLNSTITKLSQGAPFNPLETFADTYRCITLDLRNAPAGRSRGPLEPDRPWDSYTDDHIALMDHLGCDRFLVLGFCIGGPFIWNLIRRVSDRIPAAVLAQPSGSRPDQRDLFYETNMKGWAPAVMADRPDLSEGELDAFLTGMYRTDPDFVFTVSREFVAACETPVLILPDDIPAHPFAVAMEAALLAPRSQVSLYPWKEKPEQIPLALRHISMFLDAHRP